MFQTREPMQVESLDEGSHLRTGKRAVRLIVPPSQEEIRAVGFGHRHRRLWPVCLPSPSPLS